MTDDSSLSVGGYTSPKKLEMPNAPIGATEPVSFSPHVNLVQAARAMLSARIKSAKYFPKTLFRDSAWDMMLELFVAGEERRRICVKQLMGVAGESSTGTMRRIDRLEEAGLIGRSPDPQDHRRVIVELSESGRAAMAAMLRDLYDPQPARKATAAKSPVTFSPR